MTTKFIRGLADYKPLKSGGTVVTIGTFDGIHRGHQEIFRRVKLATEFLNMEAVLITFHPHPRVIVSPDNVPMLLTSLEEKEQFVPHFFDGRVLVLEFNEALKNMSAEQFVRSVLVEKVSVRKLVVGYDHGLGKNREGSIPALRLMGQKYRFDLEVVSPVFHDGQPVSSSRIRRAMQDGRYTEALDLLGHDYAICGTIEPGIGLGKKIGYPTANIRYSERKLLPPQGVYACWAQLEDRRYSGMMFIGQNHFNPRETITVEANLFDFEDDIYGQEIVVYPTHHIRANRVFESKELLVEQINKDKTNVMRILSMGEQKCQ